MMAQVVNMPKLGFDMAEGTLIRWVISEGEPVAKGAVLAEIETDKATVEVEASFGGVLLRQLVAQGTVVPINDPIAVIGEAGEKVDLTALLGKEGEVKPQEKPAELEKVEAQPAPIETTQTASETVQEIHASPLARLMAEKAGIDLRQIRGTGPGGRITKKDIESYRPAPKVAKAAPIPSPTPGPVISTAESRTLPLPKLRAAIGRRMTESMQQSPHFYVTHAYDVGRLVEHRKEINALLGEDDKLSLNDFIVRAVALTLREFPNLNASLDLKNSQLIQHGQINVGVAVAVENGLLTVVNRSSDQKTVYQISSELKTMLARAREGKVRPEDIEGSTFTVSNLGMFDVDQFTAIINPPEAAILAVGSAVEQPVVVNGELRIGIRMKATLSVDHRVSDGAEGARFLQVLARYIEEPLRLLI